MLYAWIGEIILALLFVNFHPRYVFLCLYESVWGIVPSRYEGSLYLLKFSLASLFFYLPLLSSPVAHTHIGSLVVLPFTLILKFYRYFEPRVSSVSSVSFLIFFSVDFFFGWLPGFCGGFFPTMWLLAFFHKDYLGKKPYFTVFLLLLSQQFKLFSLAPKK